jgi:hypothetical protein
MHLTFIRRMGRCVDQMPTTGAPSSTVQREESAVPHHSPDTVTQNLTGHPERCSPLDDMAAVLPLSAHLEKPSCMGVAYRRSSSTEYCKHLTCLTV